MAVGEKARDGMEKGIRSQNQLNSLLHPLFPQGSRRYSHSLLSVRMCLDRTYVVRGCAWVDGLKADYSRIPRRIPKIILFVIIIIYNNTYISSLSFVSN